MSFSNLLKPTLVCLEQALFWVALATDRQRDCLHCRIASLLVCVGSGCIIRHSLIPAHPGVRLYPRMGIFARNVISQPTLWRSSHHRWCNPDLSKLELEAGEYKAAYVVADERGITPLCNVFLAIQNGRSRQRFLDCELLVLHRLWNWRHALFAPQAIQGAVPANIPQ